MLCEIIKADVFYCLSYNCHFYIFN
jgi:hypothetical protein